MSERLRLRKLSRVLAQHERTQADLSTLLRSRSRASELMQQRRYLTKAQIRLLHEHWRIPLEQLFAASFPKVVQ